MISRLIARIRDAITRRRKRRLLDLAAGRLLAEIPPLPPPPVPTPAPPPLPRMTMPPPAQRWGPDPDGPGMCRYPRPARPDGRTGR